MESKIKEKFSAYQIKIFLFCWGAYTCAYLNRVNMSIAIPGISADLGISITETGLIAGSFLWTYAIGQLINGWLGDKIPSRYMIGIGLSISALCNFVFSLTDNYYIMIIVWAMNGISQSMLWAPIVHTLSMNFSGNRLMRVSFGMSFTLVFGYLISWTSSSILQSIFNWRMIFLIPSLIVMVFCVIWFSFFKVNPKEYAVCANEKLNENDKKINSIPIYKNKGVMYLILFVVLGAIMHGVIKESINIWLPTMLENVKGFSMESTLGILFIVPIINFMGIFLSKFISLKTKANSYATIVVITVISLIFSIVLLFTQQFSAYILVAVTIILFGLMFAMNPIFTSFLPLTFSKWKVVSTMAGLIDFAIYLGAAFASMLTGYLFEKSGWFAVTIMWFAALVLCLIFTLLSNKVYKNNSKAVVKQ